MTRADVSALLLPDGRRLGWGEYGDPSGLPTLFLHGTPGGRLGGTQHHERYARMGLRVVSPERPGYGVSDPLPGRTVRTFAGDLVALLDSLELDRVVVVGGSGGGPHALALAAVAPDRVRAVGVLVGAAPLLPEEIALQVEVNQQTFAVVEDAEALRARLGPLREAMLGQGIASVMQDAPEADREVWRRNAELMNASLASALEPGVEGMLDDYRALWALDWGFSPREVRVPVVWGHGTADRNVPLAAARRVVDQLPDCRFMTWDDIGHAPTPELLCELLAATLARAL